MASLYRVDPTGPAKQQMRDLLAKAVARNEGEKVRGALEAIVSELETQPHGWGDPLHRTRKEGGQVYRGIKPPLVVRYAVFEPEKVVWLLDVRALPNTPLAE
jgi:hypothetical protein